MQTTLTTVSRRLQRLLDLFLAILLGTIILDVLLGVFSRYLFGSQVEWTEELARCLLVWVGLTGAAAGFARHAHLGLDVVVSHFAPPAQHRARLVSCFACLAFTILVLEVGGVGLTIQAFHVYRVLPALQICDGFVFLSLPVAGVFMLVFQIEELLNLLSSRYQGEP